MFADKRKIEKFLELVDSGAQVKAFARALGLSKAEVDRHRKHIGDYRHLLAAEAEHKKKTKVEPKKETSQLKSKLTGVKKYGTERKDSDKETMGPRTDSGDES